MDAPLDASDSAMDDSLASLREIDEELFEDALDELSEGSLKSLIEHPRRALSEHEAGLIRTVDESLVAPGALRVAEAFAVFIETEIEYVDE